MRLKISVLLLALAIGRGCWGQDAQKKIVPSECTKIIRVHGSFPKWTEPVKFLPKESYKRPPFIKYQIQEDGAVSNATVTCSSGVVEIDKKVLDAVVSWKYKPRPAGCGVVNSEMSVVIDWAIPR